MAEEKDIKKIERRAKNLLLSKDIPSGKMDIVRSLMGNASLTPDEKYSAIIELIQSCPDKPVEGPRLSSIELREDKKRKAPGPLAREGRIIPPPVGPAVSGAYIGDIQQKYKKPKLFKKRYLVHSGNRLGFWFRKRLVPTKKLLKIMEDVSAFQERVLASIDPILMNMLMDESLTDATAFNYLAQLKRRLGAVPLSKYGFDAVKWLEQKDFERELKDYTAGFFSYYLVTADMKEAVIQAVEKHARTMDGFRKEAITGKDSERTKSEKEKNNLEAEKRMFALVHNVRSFFPAGEKAESALSRYLDSKYDVPSLGYLLLAMNEALVFQREIKVESLAGYYRVSPLMVDSESFQYNIDILKKYGKDEESRKRKKVDELKEELTVFEEIYLYLKLEISGTNLLLKFFDDQWRIADRRRGDSSEEYKNDFIAFVDGLLNYFNNLPARFLDGSVIVFESGDETFEGRIFTESYFERELKGLEEITREFYYLRTNNPNLVVPYEELQRIFRGQIKTMSHVGAFLKKTGGFFYNFGRNLHRVLENHRLWARMGKALSDKTALRVPLDKSARESLTTSEGRPIPFHDCRVKSLRENVPLMRTVAGMPVIGGDYSSGILLLIIALCYQLAFECGDEEIQGDLENRKKILSTLRELTD